MNAPLIAKVAGGTAALSAVSAGVTYEATKTSIGDYNKNTVLQRNSSQEEWNRAERKFKKLTKKNEWLEEFKNLHDKLNGENTEKSTLKNTCLALYEKPYGSVFSRDNELSGKIVPHCSKAEEIIWDKVKDVVFPEGFNETTTWKKAQDKLKDDSSKSNELVEPFKDLYANLQTGKTHASDNTGNPLKKACEVAYEIKVDEDKPKSEKLTKQARTYCSITIKEMFESGKTFDETGTSDDTQLQTKMAALEANTVKENADLKQKFTEWKTGGSDTKKKKDFRDWCNGLYKKQYFGSAHSDWTLADTNCKKQ